jgi:hypothetical protein
MARLLEHHPDIINQQLQLEMDTIYEKINKKLDKLLDKQSPHAKGHYTGHPSMYPRNVNLTDIKFTKEKQLLDLGPQYNFQFHICWFH